MLFAGLAARSQSNKAMEPAYYVFDKSGKPCKMEDAIYFGCFQKLSDTAWQWKYYNYSGPLISVETYRDEQMTIPNGYFAYFDVEGTVDSSGFTLNGKRDKTWYYFTDSLTVWQSEDYNNGLLIERKNRQRLDEDHETFIRGNFTKVEREAVFKGGDGAWRKYLEKNMKFPDRANTLGKTGTIYVNFVVDKDGSTSETFIIQSVEFSLDEEAMRLIKKSPKWEPAIKDGLPIKAWRRQPFTFDL